MSPNLRRRIRLTAFFAAALVSLSLVTGDPEVRAEAASTVSTASSASSAYTQKGADTCLSCHNDDSMLLIFRTPHGQGSDPNTPFAHLQCESCHGAGGEHAGRRNVGAGHPPIIAFGRDTETPVDEQNGVCMNCHKRHLGMQWTGSVHQRNQIACADCHSSHATVDPVSVLTRQAEVCFDCHKKQRADSMKPYAHPVRFGVMTCTACHDPHQSASDSLLKRNTLNELCWSCHTELRGPYLFEHAPVSEDCALCHEAHGSIHQAMLNKRPPLLCQSCHSQRGHPSISFNEDSLGGGGRPPSAFVVNGSCLNCHSQIHGSNHPSGGKLMR
ncbi:DmsE family decaheme c-type cytochrome [Thiogranum longum]